MLFPVLSYNGGLKHFSRDLSFGHGLVEDGT